ncbi:MAG: phytoene desaturase [Flavobacteriales bacterium]|nr:phytoene desaturase [Flavobacteriales bacterium]
MKKKITVIGGGFAGLASACSLASRGFEVDLLEKNTTTGGRGRSFSAQGFTFDMGPSWYWMPGVFEDFFSRFGKKVSDYYELIRLDPSYRVYFRDGEQLDIPANYEALRAEFEKLEIGAGSRLDAFMAEAKVKYDVSMKDFVWKPSLSITEFMHPALLRESIRLDLFSSFSKHARKYFRHPKILQLLEFPVLFLGAKPSGTPAMYSMMNYADIMLGTWYPKGGMLKIAESMTKLAVELGVKIHTDADVSKIIIDGEQASGVMVNGSRFMSDAVVAAADYQHVEQKLIDAPYRNYDESYWTKRTMSPSSLIFYIGVKRKLPALLHHNLFFDEDFGEHAEEIYDKKSWPDKPLFYLCCSSRTDDTVAPEGMENIFILIPVATGLTSTEEQRKKYLDICIQRIKKHTGEDISNDIVFYQSYAHEEFTRDYNAYQGNAYGLANTLKQTAILKPRMRSKKVKNLFYAGQLTVPGPGVPPSIISGQIAATEVTNYLEHH